MARAAALAGRGRSATLADRLLVAAAGHEGSRLAGGLLVIAATGLVAACAQVTIPWYPVPFTGQTFGVLLAAGALGWRRGALAMGLYWALAAAGLPVMAGGTGGWAAVTSPTGGYVVGFIVAAAVVGALCERGADRSAVAVVGALLVGEAAIYAVGVPWLALSEISPGAGRLGFAAAYRAGLEPFILGDLAKLAAVAALLPAGWGIAGRVGESSDGDRPRLV